MTFLKNLALFFVVLLPVAAIIGMVLEGLSLPGWETSPEWHVGWNPVMWLIVSSPWILPTVVLVPVLHFLGRAVARRASRRTSRLTVVLASPVLFCLGMTALWGPANVDHRTLVPIAAAALVYGAVLRIARATGI